ncbi:helix-turn-helix domain-containing protein [Thiobaca trueperi]|uniref:Transcriptional regulator with XRE-family HTH domain n=1 Tax=Thiobaca trueperi TaxID=127458 RepID=A0A4V2V1H2_9GAMM|nr:helix-turn-helix transcriptional regulator [Thiobaca trueperi]TCT21202.1 transcriptional regulator with XRE-family HTH domain [Thiobaca trueperi]
MDPAALALTARIGQRLRAERNRHRLSLADLSARTGLSKSRISNYEQGLRRLGLESACTLAAALETVTPAWLFGLDHAPDPLTDEELELLRRFRAADAGGQRTIVAVTRAIAICCLNRREP